VKNEPKEKGQNEKTMIDYICLS